MRAWFFTEDAYPQLPNADSYRSIRVNLPNKHFDPETGADNYHQFLDMWLMAEELGLEVMLNEHHQTATCVVPAVPIMAGILARETKTARILVLGNPLANLPRPTRTAEEMAMIDVISRGRLECGFVRGVPYESAPANVLPYRGTERMWEAHDLIVKAWTTHNGPFNFEGRWFHARQVNIWPRPWQQPHPPVWVTIGSAGTAIPVAEHNYVGAVFLAGYPGVRSIFNGYRQGYRTRHGADAPLDRLAYCALVYVADDEAEAKAGGNEVLWYMTSNKVATEYINPPGYHPPAVAAQIANGGNLARSLPSQTTLDAQMERGNVFCGTPDQVYEQIKTFYDYSGGFGNLLIMGQAGHLTFEQTRRSMSLFASEVYPRLKELTAGYDVDEMSATQARLPDQQGIDLGTFGLEFAR
ncbi:MAG: LLM class flavin-dependent oxidoreductase [Rhodospirillaceae bacterium]|nr:LLM class flavin-dependent oxidoreductase [Rhodospirillaceae bacterium]